MATRSCIIIKVRPEDIGKVMKFKNELLPVPQKDWNDADVPDMAEPVKIGKDYIAIYQHWDGYPDGVGAALKANFKTYEQALNLILGGSTSVIDEDHITRYAVRQGENWKYLKPLQRKAVKSVVNVFEKSWCEYAYLFDEDKGWQVKSLMDGHSKFEDF